MEALPSQIIDWLGKHPDHVKYIQIDSFPRPPSAEEIEKHKNDFILSLSSVNNFYNLNLLAKCPKSPSDVHIYSRDYSKDAIELSRKLKFLYHYKYKLENKKFQESVNITSELLDFMESIETFPDQMRIIIKETHFFSDMLSDPPLLERITQYIMTLENELYKMTQKPHRYKPNVIKKYIRECEKYCNQELHFFERMPIQEDFENLIFHSQSPIKADIEDFLNKFGSRSRTDFTPGVFQLFIKLKSSFSLKPIDNPSIAMLLFIRAIFDESIAKNYDFFFPGRDNNLYKVVKNLKISVLGPPKDYFFVDCPDDALVAEIFKMDQLYNEAGKYLTNISLLTNPLDILHEISLSLECIQNAVKRTSKHENDAVLPFETIFSLFFGSLLTSDLPDFEETVTFLSDFAPNGKLSPSFQYTLVTISAALAQLQTYYDEEVGK